MNRFDIIKSHLQKGEACVLVTVGATRGSTPRDTGTWMVIAGMNGQHGTIGGGALEWQATRHARQLLADASGYGKTASDLILGPDLNQCCGGRLELVFETFTENEANRLSEFSAQFQGSRRQPLCIFGAGHVGKALARACAPLDFAITLVDQRAEMVNDTLPQSICQKIAQHPAQLVATLAPATLVVIMTHSHELDYAICRKALMSDNVAFTGLIGSQTKRARFVKRLAHEGIDKARLDRLHCPIARGKINSKKPAIIAASIAVHLLEQSQLVKTAQNNVRSASKSA